MSTHQDWPGPPPQYQPGHDQQQYRGPYQPQRPARQRRRWPLATGTGLAGLVLGGIIGAAGAGSDPAPATLTGAQPATSSAAAAKPKPAASSPAVKPASALPAGVDVSGTTDLQVISFKARIDGIGSFAPVLRVRNTTREALQFAGVKVTALDGGDVVATADALIESIGPGQTVTVEPVSADPLKSTKGLAYAVELAT